MTHSTPTDWTPQPQNPASEHSAPAPVLPARHSLFSREGIREAMAERRRRIERAERLNAWRATEEEARMERLGLRP